jgi:hypothetical protein
MIHGVTTEPRTCADARRVQKKRAPRIGRATLAAWTETSENPAAAPLWLSIAIIRTVVRLFSGCVRNAMSHPALSSDDIPASRPGDWGPQLNGDLTAPAVQPDAIR